MLLWLKEYIGTIIIGLVVLAVVTAIIVRLILRKRAGKCAGCDCCDCKNSCMGAKRNANLNETAE